MYKLPLQVEFAEIHDFQSDIQAELFALASTFVKIVGTRLKIVVYLESARPINGNKQYRKNGIQTATLTVCIFAATNMDNVAVNRLAIYPHTTVSK